jgi:hypothetical protein
MAQVVRPRTFPVAQTPGEIALLDFLGRELGNGWTVYVKPFLNGDEPDLAHFSHQRSCAMAPELA